MTRSSAGSSTVECLIALTMFTLGALGASGVLALSLRLATEGDRAAAAARLLADETGRLRAALAAGGGACAGVTPGSQQTPTGVQVSSSVTAAPGGLRLLLTVSYTTVRGQHADTTIGFLACR